MVDTPLRCTGGAAVAEMTIASTLQPQKLQQILLTETWILLILPGPLT
jgi:hypothetical protein